MVTRLLWEQQHDSSHSVSESTGPSGPSEEYGATSGQQQGGVLEFQMWLPLACEDCHSCDVVAYWEANKGKLPNVAVLAQQYLATQATSVDSERLFSFAGSTIKERRNRQDPENVEQLLFVHHNCCIQA